jgi:DHA2 family multidrug resistance protein
MLRNLGGAIGTATLQTIITMREQYHSNIIGHAITVYSEATRDRIAKLTGYFLSHGVSDVAIAQRKAIVSIGTAVHRQALVMGFSDAFGVLGLILVLAAVAILSACKVRLGKPAEGAWC